MKRNKIKFNKNVNLLILQVKITQKTIKLKINKLFNLIF